MPELSKLIALSDWFQVSVDDLVREERTELDEPHGPAPEMDRLEEKLDRLTEEYQRSWGPYFAYTSRAHIGRLPLVSVRLGPAATRWPSGSSPWAIFLWDWSAWG